MSAIAVSRSAIRVLTALALLVLVAGCSSDETATDDDPVETAPEGLDAVAVDTDAADADTGTDDTGTDEADAGGSDDPAPANGAREDGVALGDAGRVLWDRPVRPQDWHVTVTGVTESPEGVELDAPTIEGRVPVLIDLEVTNAADEREVISTLGFGAGDDATDYLLGVDSCGTTFPNAIPALPLNIEGGETVQRAVCFQADPDHVASLSLWAEPNGFADLRVWFDLR